ncbi:amidase [Geodermatophilus sp. SYSU D00691]
MTSTTTELWQLGAVEVAAAVRSGRASCREVVEAHLRRIEAVNPAVNAVVVVLGEQALDAADAADRAVAAGDELGPLHGVPFTVKGLVDLAGTPTTQGLRALTGAYPARDAPAVERLEAAGAIPIGRTNLASFGVRWHCESELWGATVNPWDRSRTAGASSGGDAAAVATGMTPLGLGGDGLGSLRSPAECCGVSTLKPTLGRIPDASSVPGPGFTPIGAQLTVVVGPMARRVADLRTALEVVAGESWRDPWSVPAPLRGPEPARPLRVALVLDPAGQGTAEQVQDGVRTAGRVLEEAGYVVEEVEPPSIDLAARTDLDMLNTPEVRAALPGLAPLWPAETRRFLAEFYDVLGELDPVAAMDAFATRHALLRSWGEFQQTHPLVVAPVSTEVPFRVGTDLGDGAVADTVRGMRMAIAVNALGLPAAAVPVGVADGLPQVVQVIGPRYREDLCLDAAAALEDRLGVLTPIDPR